MQTVINNTHLNLEVTKKLSTFAVPNRVKSTYSSCYISDRIKASLLFDNSTHVVLHGLATFNRGLVSLYSYISSSNFGLQMPNRDVNLTANAPGAFASTCTAPRKMANISLQSATTINNLFTNVLRLCMFSSTGYMRLHSSF